MGKPITVSSLMHTQISRSYATTNHPLFGGTLEKNNGTISPCNMPKNALGLGLDGGFFFSRISRQIEV